MLWMCYFLGLESPDFVRNILSSIPCANAIVQKLRAPLKSQKRFYWNTQLKCLQEVCRRQTVHVFYFSFRFLDLHLLFGKQVVWIKYFLFSFSSYSPSCSKPRGHHSSICKEIFQLDLWGSVMPFYKEKDKIQKGRRENKAPINSSWVNRQTGAAEQGSPLKKTHILLVTFNYTFQNISALKNRHFISKKGEHSNILLYRDEKAHLWIIQKAS